MGIPDQSLVSPEAFSAAMTQRWLDLGNTPSPRLVQVWSIMASTFAAAITFRDRKWRVLQPPTGTGKTQGLCVYAALTITKNLASPEPVGILVVTRTIQQANEIVDTIREFVPECGDRVQTKHSENKLSIFQMMAADVLVLTHAAYTLALEGLHKEEYGRWWDYTNWERGPRRLTIIDEALSGVVEANQVRAEHVRQLLGYVDPMLRRQFASQVAALETIRDTLEEIDRRVSIAQATEQQTCQKLVWSAVHAGRIAFPECYRMGPLRKAMAGLAYDQIALRKSSQADRARIAKQMDHTLRNCEAVMRRWAYYSQKGRDGTLNSSRLLIPDDLPGPVVLDATATQNFLWTLLEQRAEIASIPQGARNYAQVTLRVAQVPGGLGKGAMTKLCKDRIPRVLANLARTLPPDRKVLLCVHKAVEPVALTYAPNFAKFSVAHWGAIDGKNDWCEYDTSIILGLSYRDQVWSTNMFFALQGLQDNQWLERPTWKMYANVHREMQWRQLAVSIIQAINRVRCRRVVDVDGNCPPTDIFIVLREGDEGKAILAHIQEEMLGMVIEPWVLDLDGPQERVRRGSSHEAVLALMRNRLPGETSMSFIRSELGLTDSGSKELMGVLRDDQHHLTKALAEIGVHYVTNGRGKGARSFLLKM